MCGYSTFRRRTGWSSVLRVDSTHEDGSGGGGDEPDTSDCTYTCAEYEYAPGQCYQGWLCESSGECLVNVGSCPGDDGDGDGSGDGACEYSCAEYDYAPGECYEGWTCDSAGQCLLDTGDC